jgi:subtilase family serine protease
MTRTFEIEIRNDGNVDSGPFTVELAYDGPVSGVLDELVSNVPPASSHWLNFTLVVQDEGQYRISVRIDSQDSVSESTECNNQVSGSIAFPPQLVFLPLIARGAR